MSISDVAGGHFPIPKRALDDGGSALWMMFVDRLIGKRNLIRPRQEQRIIVNSSAR